MKKALTKLIVCNLFLFVLLSFNVLSGQERVRENAEAQTLKPNQAVEHQMKGGETQSFQINLKAGQYGRVEVSQKYVDVVVSLFDAGGRLVAEMDGKGGFLWRESVSCLAEDDGAAFQVKVRAYGTAEQVGNYTIKLAELRPVETKDRQSIEAEQYFYKGRKLYLQDQPDYEAAIKEYEAAVKIWHELGEKNCEAVTLINLGWAYQDLSKSEMALSLVQQAALLFRETKDRVGEGKATNGVGLSYLALGQYEKAAQFFEEALGIRREVNDKRGEVNTLGNLGFVYGYLSQNEKAKGYLEQALAIARDTKDRSSEGAALGNLGFNSLQLKQYEKARDFYEQALAIKKELRDRRGEGETLAALGFVYWNLTQHERARGFYEHALTIERDLKDRTGEGKTLSALGGVFFDLKQFEKAREYYEQALTVKQEVKDRVGERIAVNGLGLVCWNLKQYEKARNFYEQGLVIARETKDRKAEEDAHSSLGQLFWNLSQFEKARNSFQQGLSIAREVKDRKGESYLLSHLGQVHNDLGEFEKATNYLEQSLTIMREVQDQNGEGLTLLRLGAAYWGLSQNEKAINHYKQALTIARETRDRSNEGGILINLGHVYTDLSQYERARDYFEQALMITKEVNNRRDETLAVNGLGNVYYSLYQYEKARDYFEQGLVISREVKDRHAEGYALGSVGNVYAGLKQSEKARDYYEQALVIAKETKDRQLEGKVMGALGAIYRDLSQYDKAKNYYEQSLAIHREIKSRHDEGLTLFKLGVIYQAIKQYEKARDNYEQALTIMREVKSRSEESYPLISLMYLWNDLGKPQLAILYGKQAINVFQEIRGSIKKFDKGAQGSYLKDKINHYRQLSDLLITQGRLPEAQAVLDLLKEEEYEQIMVRRSGDSPNIIPYGKAESEVIAKIETLATQGRRQSELQKLQKEKGSLSAAEQQELTKVLGDIEVANKAFRVALDALGKSDVSVEDKVAEIESEKNLQRALSQLSKELNTGAVAIYTVIGTAEERDANGEPAKDKPHSKFGWVIMVTPEARKAYPIDVSDLENTVFQFRTALSSDKYDPQPLAEKLYNAIFRQTSEKQKKTLEGDLVETLGKYKDKTIMWSLDGVLRYVPMAALHDGKNYLVEKYRHIVFTKQSLLLLNEKDSAKWQALGLGVSEKREGFNALPGAEKELRDIVRQPETKTGIFEGTIRLNNDFKKDETLLLWREGKYPIIHIASHYSFNPLDQMASFLLLGDGKLTFAEIQDKDNLFGGVDLLTLSACDTAMSANGKESEGFAYLAQSLGAKSVIASLWKVADAGTPELMIRFYKLRSENPQMPKGEAFRQAQLSLLGTDTEDGKNISTTKRAEIVEAGGKKVELTMFVKDGKRPFAHPYFWSAFVLIGNWR